MSPCYFGVHQWDKWQMIEETWTRPRWTLTGGEGLYSTFSFKASGVEALDEPFTVHLNQRACERCGLTQRRRIIE